MSVQIALNPSEISELIRDKIEHFKVASEARNEGTIVSLKDGIVRLHGLDDVMQGEMIEFPGGVYGLALNLERDSVGAVILGNAVSDPVLPLTAPLVNFSTSSALIRAARSNNLECK